MSDTEGYNGWTNYPTWNVALWLANDEGLYRETLDIVEWNKKDDDEDHMVVVDLADALKSWVVDELAPDLDASFAADLLGYALDQVDWQEIAKNLLDD